MGSARPHWWGTIVNEFGVGYGSDFDPMGGGNPLDPNDIRRGGGGTDGSGGWGGRYDPPRNQDPTGGYGSGGSGSGSGGSGGSGSGSGSGTDYGAGNTGFGTGLNPHRGGFGSDWGGLDTGGDPLGAGSGWPGFGKVDGGDVINPYPATPLDIPDWRKPGGYDPVGFWRIGDTTPTSGGTGYGGSGLGTSSGTGVGSKSPTGGYPGIPNDIWIWLQAEGISPKEWFAWVGRFRKIIGGASDPLLWELVRRGKGEGKRIIEILEAIMDVLGDIEEMLELLSAEIPDKVKKLLPLGKLLDAALKFANDGDLTVEEMLSIFHGFATDLIKAMSEQGADMGLWSREAVDKFWQTKLSEIINKGRTQLETIWLEAWWWWREFLLYGLR